MTKGRKISSDTFDPFIACAEEFLIDFIGRGRNKSVDRLGSHIAHRVILAKIPIDVFFQEVLERSLPIFQNPVAIFVGADTGVEHFGLAPNQLLRLLFVLIDVVSITIHHSTAERERTKPVDIGHIGLFCELCSQFVEGVTDIPALRFFQTLLHETCDPLQFERARAQFAQHLVDRTAYREFIVQFHAETGGESEIMSQSREHRLEKRVDGHDAKVVIAVQNLVQRLPSAGTDMLIVEGLRESIAHGTENPHLREVVDVGQLEKILQDALLHLVGGLFGKGNGQLMSVRVIDRMEIVEQIGDEFGRQRERLSRSCRGLINAYGFGVRGHQCLFFPKR